MRLKIDHEADALYRNLSDAPSESEEVSPGIIVNNDELGRASGVEMLHLSNPVAGTDVQRLIFERVHVTL